MDLVNIIGLVAGTLVTGSALPKLAERLANVASGRTAFSLPDFCRDTSQGVGNLLWVAVGLASGLYAVTIFCGLSSLLLAILVVLNLRGACPRPGRRREQ